MLTKNDVEIIKALLIAHAQATSNAGDIHNQFKYELDQYLDDRKDIQMPED